MVYSRSVELVVDGKPSLNFFERVTSGAPVSNNWRPWTKRRNQLQN
jgi:hypothetical protein